MEAKITMLRLVFILMAWLHVSVVYSRSILYNTTASRVPGKLNVHIVSHTHNDPGWLSSYVQYHRELVLDGHVIGGVEAILDSVVNNLLDNPDRTYVYADMAFFVKWWQELHPDTQAIVRGLVKEGRLEFTNGGITQHDEATSHYSGMIDQMTLGMRFLQKEFGITPKIAWQLDGFGHSSTEPLLKAMGGFDALFFGRSDQADFNQRKANHSLELIWRGSEHFGTEADVFTSQYPTGNYGPPSMTWWFERRNDYGKPLPDWIRDDPEGQGFNFEDAVNMFVSKAEEWKGCVQGEDVVFFMGGDFTHSDARMWFNNIDKLIHYVNKDGRVNAFYSTPSRYVAAKRNTSGIKLALKTDDFFPYSADAGGHDFWTGYFTSRPTLKSQIRRGWSLLQAGRQVEVFSELSPGTRNLATTKGLQYSGKEAKSETVKFGLKLAPDHDLAPLEFALATSLHHDGITGTQKKHVTEDYETWIHVAMTKAAPKFLQGLQHMLYPKAKINAISLPSNDSGSADPSAALGKFLIGSVFRRRLLQDEQKPLDQAGSALAGIPALHMCLNINSSLCSSSVKLSKEDSGFLLVVYNPLSWEYEWGVRVPVSSGSYSVTGPDGKAVASQILPLSNSTEDVWPNYAMAKADQNKPAVDLAIMVSAPPLGHAVYKITKGGSATVSQVSPVQNAATLSNGKLELTLGSTGISSIKVAGKTISYKSALIKYQGSFSRTGAYTFQATGGPDMPNPQVTVVQGPLVQEVRQEFGLGVLISRLWKGSSHLEVEWTVGPPPNGNDWEVFVRYQTDIKSSGVWYTDANGREYQQRKKQYRPAFRIASGSKELAGNIYPITTGCYLKDTATVLNIAVDRAEGAVSLADGQMDINLHRVSAGDDGKGMQEPLIDHHVAVGTHIISFGKPDGTSGDGGQYTTRRHIEQVLNDPLQLAFSPVPTAKYKATSTALPSANSLPANVHLLTTRWISCSTVLVRLSHMFQAGEHPELSKPASVDLHKLLGTKLQIVSVQEATLYGERLLAKSDLERPTHQYGANLTVWDPPLATPPGGFSYLSNRLIGQITTGTQVTLNPMQIRAFYVTVKRTETTCVDPPEPMRRVTSLSTSKLAEAAAAAAAAGGKPATAAPGVAHTSWLQEVESGVQRVEQAAMAFESAAVNQVKQVVYKISGPSSQKTPLSQGVMTVMLVLPFCVAVGIAAMMLNHSKLSRVRHSGGGEGKQVV